VQERRLRFECDEETHAGFDPTMDAKKSCVICALDISAVVFPEAAEVTVDDSSPREVHLGATCAAVEGGGLLNDGRLRHEEALQDA
jgi:hypothetical protein